jgi:hypothetical protein
MSAGIGWRLLRNWEALLVVRNPLHMGTFMFNIP